MARWPAATVLLVVLPLSQSACSGSGASPPPPPAATEDGPPCGPATVNGVQVMTWCGAGSVEVKRAGTVLDLPAAVCDRSMGPNELAVSAGSTVRSPGDAAKVPTATGFSLFISGAPEGAEGTFEQVVFGGNDSGEAFVADKPGSARAELTSGGTTGTFGGVDDSGRRVTGTFTCQ